MHTAFELKNLTMKPRINDISLQVLADYYTMFLYPFIYKYSVKNNGIDKQIELCFGKENFCHLVGMETVAKYSVPYQELRRYKGLDGWNSIYGNNEDGFVIDISHLKSLNKKKFQSVKAKFVYFYLLPNLIAVPMAVNFKKQNVELSTRIDCELMLYSKVNNDNAILHLGIKQDKNLGFYIPKTFFVEKVSDKQNDIYLANQEEVKTTVLIKVIML